MSKRYYEKTLTEDQISHICKQSRTVPRYFDKVYVMITAASKMLSHAHFGQPRQVMGLLQGSFHQQKGKGIYVVSDVIFLPVESSQTRVTCDEQTNLLIAHAQWISKIKTHNIIGWYHSHPSYGCWMSGIDVTTQQLFQKSDPYFLAIVVDPIKSVNLQKIDMGAFRVHPHGYKDQSLANVKDVPRRKAVDFGYHYKRYYQVPIEFVASDLGLHTLQNLQKLQWANELSNSSFFKQSDYLRQEANDQKLDVQEYLLMKEDPSVKHSDLKEKQRTTLKKVAYYTKQRNISLIDAAVKNLLF